LLLIDSPDTGATDGSGAGSITQVIGKMI